MRLTSAENYASEISNPYTATIYQTLKSVFPAIVVSPGSTNFFFASSVSASVSASPTVLAERYIRLVRPPTDLATIFSSLYPDEKTKFSKKVLEQYQAPALNRDQRPKAYFLYGRLLGWTSGSPLSGMFDFFEKMKFKNLLLFTILPLIPAFLWILYRRKKTPGNFSVLLAAFSGGFAGLAFEILTIFTFQNIWGFVYQAIGLLIAAFMFGMGCGAALTGAYLKRRQPSREKAGKLLAGTQLLIAVASLTCLPLMGLLAKMARSTGQIALYSWLAGMGFLVGTILPLGLHMVGRAEAAKKAGLVNAADYLGGAIGAMAMAAIFLPLFGSANSLLLIAIPALAAALLLLLESRFNAPGSA